MKTLQFLTLAILTITLFASCNNSTSTSNADDKMKDIAGDIASMKSYIIEYKTVMSMPQMKSITTMTQWIDIGNDKFVMESATETEMMGTKQSSKSLMIEDGEWSYMIDLEAKTGYKSKSGEGEDDPTDMIKSDDEVTFRQMIEKEGGKILANETFLGKDCIVVEMSEKSDDGKALATKMWYYKGIPLKMNNKSYTMEATKFEENVSIPASKFEVPAGITMSEMPAMPQ
jgi:outer membrane lipoprotein-sorting protein